MRGEESDQIIIGRQQAGLGMLTTVALIMLHLILHWHWTGNDIQQLEY